MPAVGGENLRLPAVGGSPLHLGQRCSRPLPGTTATQQALARALPEPGGTPLKKMKTSVEAWTPPAAPPTLSTLDAWTPPPTLSSTSRLPGLTTEAPSAAIGARGVWKLEAPTLLSTSRLPGLKKEAPSAAIGARGVWKLEALAPSSSGGLRARGLPTSPDPVGPKTIGVGLAFAASSDRALPTLQDAVEKTWGPERLLAHRPPPQRRLRKKTKWCLRPCASLDLELLSSLYGADLAATDTSRLPRDWLNPECARKILLESGLRPEDIDVLEVYAGTAHWTAACQSLGLRVGPAIDIKLAIGGKTWNLLEPRFRRVLWAIVVACKPKWVHSGFPCTFWTPLAHCTRKRSEQDDEMHRIRELVHLVLTLQLARWQASQKYHISLENPPKCASWRMDITQDTLAAIGATKYYFDSCPWGHRDPGNGKPYKKAQCIASTGNLSSLVRKCTCGSEKDVHQRVEGMVSILLPGTTKRMRRSTYAGAYPKELCKAWAKAVQGQVRS